MGTGASGDLEMLEEDDLASQMVREGGRGELGRQAGAEGVPIGRNIYMCTAEPLPRTISTSQLWWKPGAG